MTWLSVVVLLCILFYFAFDIGMWIYLFTYLDYLGNTLGFTDFLLFTQPHGGAAAFTETDLNVDKINISVKLE